MTTDTRSALEIAVAALRLNRDEAESQLSTNAPREQAWERVLRDATRALAAMRAAPGLADDLWLRDIIGNFLSDCGPTLVHQTERCLAAIRVYEAAQREKA